MLCLYLPCGCVSPEIRKLSCKPVVDLIESQLSLWGLENGLGTVRERTKVRGEHRRREETVKQIIGETYMTYKRRVGKGRPDISVLVELTVLGKL